MDKPSPIKRYATLLVIKVGNTNQRYGKVKEEAKRENKKISLDLNFLSRLTKNFLKQIKIKNSTITVQTKANKNFFSYIFIDN